MRVYFLKQKCLDMLEHSMRENLSKYQSDEVWINQFFVEKEKANYFFDTGLEVNDYELKLGGPETDFENAKILYEAFRGKINLVQASDLRLWGFLAHDRHWDYMRVRWGIDVSNEEDDEMENDGNSMMDKALSRIGTRYFFTASKGKAFVRQGIARLYWSAYLTYDENNVNGDPYEYTKFFFSKQDIFTSITERSYSRNKVLLLAALKELRKYPDLSREEIRAFLAKLNQAGAITVFDFLNQAQAKTLCESVMEEIKSVPRLTEGSIFCAVNNITGKKYGSNMTIKDGKILMAGKAMITKPKNLIGKKEGSKFIISGKEYVITEVKSTS